MILKEKTVASFVAENYKTADVFKKYHIDFCCGGNISLEAICSKNNINLEEISNDLDKIFNENISPDENYNSWSVGKLVYHILDNHHVYIRTSIPTIETYLLKLKKVHGENHPELIQIQELFYKMARDLEQHLMKEENIIFPYALQLNSVNNSSEVPKPFFGSIKNPINMMHFEHESAGNEAKLIRKLTNDFLPPEDACNTYRVAFKKLEEFETDLFKHVHLENNILFPKIIDLESKIIK